MIDTDNLVMWGLGILLVLLIAVGVPMAIIEHNKWENDCIAKGGHVEDSTKTGVGTGVGTNGTVVTTTTTTTTYFCLTDDGRVLGIK